MSDDQYARLVKSLEEIHRKICDIKADMTTKDNIYRLETRIKTVIDLDTISV